MDGATAITARHAADTMTAEIRIIWNDVRRNNSTLGRLRAMTSDTRTLRLRVPGTPAPRAHERVTYWHQLIGGR